MSTAGSDQPATAEAFIVRVGCHDDHATAARQSVELDLGQLRRQTQIVPGPVHAPAQSSASGAAEASTWAAAWASARSGAGWRR